VAISIAKISPVLAAAAAFLAGACAVPDPPQARSLQGADRQCFLPSQVNGFHSVDVDTVHVNVGARTVFELEVAGCPDVDWARTIGIRSTAGASWVCQNHDAELLVAGPIGQLRCPVTAVRQLSPAEVEALRARRRG
jgi:hypothetical protein